MTRSSWSTETAFPLSIIIPVKAQLFLSVPPSLILEKLYILSTQCVHVFCMDLRRNSDFFSYIAWNDLFLWKWQCVFCAVRPESLYISHVAFRVSKFSKLSRIQKAEGGWELSNAALFKTVEASLTALIPGGSRSSRNWSALHITFWNW